MQSSPKRFFNIRDDSNAHGWIVDLPISNDSVELAYSLTEGNVVTDVPLPIVLERVGGGATTDWTTMPSWGVPVLSRRLARLLEKVAPSDVQFLPARVSGDDSTWEVLNLLQVLDCVDRDRTNELVVELGGGGLLQLVIEPGKVGGSHIFRASGLPIVADELVKAAFDDANIVGAMWYQLTMA